MSNFGEYRSTFWKINYPSHWVLEKHPECVSLYDEDGFGALQISAYLKNEKITGADLQEFIEDEIPPDTKPDYVAIAEFDGMTAEFNYENHFWRKWFLKKDKLLLFVTYNCEREDLKTERNAIDSIVNSLKYTG